MGYEGKFGHDGSHDEPSQTNDDRALANCVVGILWVISVALLHTRFIGSDGRSRPHAGLTALTSASYFISRAAASIHCELAEFCSAEAFLRACARQPWARAENQKSRGRYRSLTAREREVMACLVAGLLNK